MRCTTWKTFLPFHSSPFHCQSLPSLCGSVLVWYSSTCLFVQLVGALGFICKPSLPRPLSWNSSILFSWGNFTVSGFTFKIVLYSELISIYGEKQGSHFIFLFVDSSFPCLLLWRNYSFLIVFSWHSYGNNMLFYIINDLALRFGCWSTENLHFSKTWAEHFRISLSVTSAVVLWLTVSSISGSFHSPSDMPIVRIPVHTSF